MLTRLQAHIAAGYGYKLVDKLGEEYKIQSTHNSYFLTDDRLIHFISFDKIGTDYFILARDLSQLTEEIEHEGERFVPIECAASILNIELERAIIDDDYIWYGINERLLDDVQDYEFGFCPKIECFGFYYGDKEGGSIVNEYPNPELNKKMREWGFNLDFPPQCVKPLK